MIPKPPTYTSEGYPIYKLRGIYPWSEGRLEVLRETIRSASKEILVNGQPPRMQDTKRWKKFQQKVVRVIPELEEFEDYWPIFVFLRVLRKNERLKKQRESAVVRRMTGRRPSVGLPRLQKGRKSDAFRSMTGPKSDAVCRMTRPRPSAFVGLPLPQNMRFQSNGRVIGGRSEERLTIDAGCVVCLFCNYTPDIPATAKAHIQVFSQNQAVIDALARLGIVNDKHLSILNHLTTWNAGPEQFMDSLSEGMLSPLYKFSLLQHFEQYFMPRDLTSVSRDINCWSGCPHHSRGNNDIDRVPLKLRRLLENFGMEELAPVFHAAHVTSSDEFDLLHALDETPRLAIFAGEQFRPMRSFQQWMLKFILLHIDVLDQ